MSDTSQPPRRRGRPRKPLPAEGTHHLEGDRQTYVKLAAQMEILGFTEGDDLFTQREVWLWNQLWALAQKRGLVELVDDPPTNGKTKQQ